MKSYNAYLGIPGRQEDPWECTATSVGYERVQPVKEQTGISPKQYQLQIRLHKAQDFLANTSKSVGEIADILGFDSAFHLSKQFKDCTGLAPQAWRKRLVGQGMFFSKKRSQVVA